MRSPVLTLVISYLVISSCHQDCFNANKEWNLFKIKYHKSYRNVEEEHRRKEIFLENLKTICEHNEKFKKHLETYRKGVNYFADMDFNEFSNTHLGFNSKMMKTSSFNSIPFATFSQRSEIPNSVNWIEKGAVTRVRRQGTCGSCYAFSAIGSVESQLYRKYNTLIELSAQQIVDCSIKNGNEGCVSGVMSQSFDYMTENGVQREFDYPYNGMNESCTFDESKIALRIKGYVQLPPGDENTLMRAVAKIGPISAAMEVTNNTRQFIGESVFYDRACHRSSDFMNHAVLIVGYGTYHGLEYWLIKNSWGDSFGDNGYAKVARNKGNHCHIATDVSFPVL